MNHTTVFVHMPKGGGSTLRLMAESGFNQDDRQVVHGHTGPPDKKAWQDLSPQQLEKVKFAWGHWPFSFYIKNCASNVNSVWITGIRDPVDRALSEYWDFKSREVYAGGYYGFWHRIFNEKSIDKVMDMEFIRSLPLLEGQQMYRRLWNTQTRMLSNRDNIIIDHAGRDKKGELLPIDNYLLDESHLELAIENLEKYFSWVGLTHLTNQEFNQMSDRLGWGHHSADTIHHNPSVYREYEKDCSSEVLAKIKEWNSLDIKLYEWAIANRDRLNKKPIIVVPPSAIL